jgi:hypothetical protein
MATLGEHSAYSGVTGVHLYHKLHCEIWQRENQSGHKCILQGLESKLFSVSSAEQGTFLEQGCQRLTNYGVMADEFPIISCDAEETTNFLQIGWDRPIHN